MRVTIEEENTAGHNRYMYVCQQKGNIHAFFALTAERISIINIVVLLFFLCVFFNETTHTKQLNHAKS